jgi:branched-chain amino acid transport system substrate-binding protein
VGYTSMWSIAEAIRKARSTDTEALIRAMRGLQVDSPFGRFTYRASDHQATMGAYVGVTAVNQGRGVMKDFRYVDGTAVLPSDAQVRTLRPADAQQ